MEERKQDSWIFVYISILMFDAFLCFMQNQEENIYVTV